VSFKRSLFPHRDFIYRIFILLRYDSIISLRYWFLNVFGQESRRLCQRSFSDDLSGTSDGLSCRHSGRSSFLAILSGESFSLSTLERLLSAGNSSSSTAGRMRHLQEYSVRYVGCSLVRLQERRVFGQPHAFFERASRGKCRLYADTDGCPDHARVIVVFRQR